MKCSKIIEELEKLSPASCACDWDNVGLLAGDPGREVHTVYLALDATDEVIAEAAQAGAELLITHHPLIFGGIRRVSADDFVGRRVWALARENMAYIAMHTNFDVCVMAELAAERMGLRDTVVLEETGVLPPGMAGTPCGVAAGAAGASCGATAGAAGNSCGAAAAETAGTPCGIGRTGSLPQALTLGQCAALVKERFGAEGLRIFGDPGATVSRVSVCPGSGKSEIPLAIRQGADVLITGDIDHHSGIDAVAQGLCVIDAGHYGLEHIFVEYMAQYLRRNLPELTVAVREHIPPYSIY